MKKVIFSVLMIAIVGSLVGIGTWAYFSDYETSEGNIFTAGDLDLKVDGEDDPNVGTYFSAPCLAPGARGLVEINLENVGCVDGVADIHLWNMASDDNGCTEPEADVDTTCGDPGAGEGELCCNLDMRITADLPPDTLPVIDGTVAPGEWDGATVINVASGKGTVSVIAEAGYLYVLVDVTDSTDARLGENLHGNDQTSININPTPAVPYGMPCDIIFQMGADPAAWGGTSSGTTDGWATDWEINGVQQMSLPGDLETMTLYDYGTSTRISEWKLPLATIAPSTGDILKVGGSVGIDAPLPRGSFSYPPGLDWSDVATYVDVVYEPLELVTEGKACDLKCIDWIIGDLPGESDIDIMIEWWIDTGVGNIIQTDTCEFDIEFSLNQKVGEADLEVTDIIQEPEAMVCEVYTIELVVHNAGTIAGNGWVFIQVKDAGGIPVYSDKAYVEGLAPCDTTTVVFTWHPTEAGPYTVVADGFECPFDIFAGANLVVTNIQQPPFIQICENLVVSVDVHNAGDMPGEGRVFTCVVDPLGNPLVMPQFLPTDMIDPDDTVKVAVDFGHVGEAWRPGGAVIAGFPVNPADPKPEELFICPMGFLKPATFEVTGIQQPVGLQPCEEIIIAVDVHNAGDKPGLCDVVTMWIEDESGTIIWGPEIGSTGVVEPCDTDKVPFLAVHANEDWNDQVITVFAQACGGVPVTCDINVTRAPIIVVTGIQQPEEIEVCNELVVAIDVHNAGGKSGECDVYVELLDEYGAPVVPAQGPFATGVMNPCDTLKIPVNFGHVEESWLPGVTVVAWACDQVEPEVCPIVVLTPPVPEPCCWCIYYVEYYECGTAANPIACDVVPEPGVTPPTAVEYYATHCDLWRDPGYTETFPPPVGDFVITDPCYESHTSFFDMNWDPVIPLRWNEVFLQALVGMADIGSWTSRIDLSTWKTVFEIYLVPGMPTTLAVYALSQGPPTPINGGPGWPYAVGDEWLSSVYVHPFATVSWTHSLVTGTQVIPGPGGDIECYVVQGWAWDDVTSTDMYPSGTTYVRNDYGCTIMEVVMPGLLISGWEFRSLIWYCQNPPFPPWEL